MALLALYSLLSLLCAAVVLCAGAVLAAALHELSHALESPLATVVNHLVSLLLEELDGGEALDLDVLELVAGRVHLGDNDVLAVLEVLAKLVVDGSERLAVAAPEIKEKEMSKISNFYFSTNRA